MRDQELRNSRLVFYKDDLDRLDRVLEELVRLSGSRSVLLVDKEGHMITHAGEDAKIDHDTISALVAGSFNATREMACLLGEQQFSALYHQGESDNIQLSLVGDRTILTVIFDDATTLGMVRLYVNEGVRKMDELFADIARRNEAEGPRSIAALEGADFEDSAKQKLDAFFDS